MARWSIWNSLLGVFSVFIYWISVVCSRSQKWDTEVKFCDSVLIWNCFPQDELPHCYVAEKVDESPVLFSCTIIIL